MGTTTIHDPSARAAEIFVASEMQRAGKILAPRIFSTGEIIYGAKAADVYAEINSFDDALAHVRRLKAQGAHERQELQPAAARAAADGRARPPSARGWRSCPRAARSTRMDITLIQDGNATLEHNMPLRASSTTTSSASGPRPRPTTRRPWSSPMAASAGDPYWRQHMDVWKHPLLSRHAPPARSPPRTSAGRWRPRRIIVDDDSAREAKKLADRGVQVSIGAHGQQAGLGPHWEMWSFVRGGWSPIEALRAGTIMPATSLGYATRRRLARSRQARRPGRARRRSDRRTSATATRSTA